MYKKIISSSLAVALGLSLSMTASAAEQGHGTVTFTGEIIAAPCSISPESVDQTVPLGQISNAALFTTGESTPRKFTIELQDCDFLTGTTAGQNSVSITFTGSTVELGTAVGDLLGLGVTGFAGESTSANVGIIISSAKENSAIIFDEALNVNTMLQPGDNTLNFSAYVKTKAGLTDVGQVPLGKFDGITNFTLSYQ